MKEKWIDQIFDEVDPFALDYKPEEEEIDDETTLDWIDEILLNPDLLKGKTITELGIGFNYIYSNSMSDYPFLYTNTIESEYRKITSIRNLSYLYKNYFEKYCRTTVVNIGYGTCNELEQLCHMFWDIFVLYPESGTPKMIQAAVDVMEEALYSPNERCIVSALHGLGHWGLDVPYIKNVIDRFLQASLITNKEIIEYAKVAKTGMIL